ncbi:DUF1461 domain-containing protein [Candidatus Woesearchaeota archaeon]|nr:DUF1461 domain-containing protein [Candidatus Woesearchaeota archaeon]
MAKEEGSASKGGRLIFDPIPYPVGGIPLRISAKAGISKNIVLLAFSCACLALIIFLSTASVVVFDRGMYQDHLEKRGIYSDMKFFKNMTPEETRMVVDQLLGYLQKGTSYDQRYFSEEEIIHMRDVRGLFYRSRVFDGVLMVLGAILFFLLLREIPRNANLFTNLLQGTAIVGGIWLLMLLVLGLFFAPAFLLFHQLLFANMYWLLPLDSTLILLFPEPFFREVFFKIVLWSGVGYLIGGVFGIALQRFRKRVIDS